MDLYAVTRSGDLRPDANMLARGLHTMVERVALGPGETAGPHVHAFEQSAYLLRGTATLTVDGQSVPLAPCEGAFVAVGAPHGWRAGEGGAVWIEASAPPPRARTPVGTWPAPAIEPAGGPYRARFRDAGDSRPDRPTGALSVFGGTTIRMLVDARLGAALHTLFTVRFDPGAALAPHDHPFEEAYVVLGGRIDVLLEHGRETLGPGDALWTGVGCVHGFANPYDEPARWLETQAPQPPLRHGFRFPGDWTDEI